MMPSLQCFRRPPRMTPHTHDENYIHYCLRTYSALSEEPSGHDGGKSPFRGTHLSPTGSMHSLDGFFAPKVLLVVA